MSTHSHIGMQLPDGRVRYIYCHFDGYLSNNGKILLKYYQDPEKISALLDLGDLSSLGEEIGEKQDFDSPKKSWCSAYHRDREEDLNEARYAASASDYIVKAINDATEYTYLFSDGHWVYRRDGHSFEEFTLDDVIRDVY